MRVNKYLLISCAIAATFSESFYLGHVLQPTAFFAIGASLVLSFVLFSGLQRGLGMALLVLEILGVGFWMVFEAWYTSADIALQAQDIALHVTLSATLILLWLTAHDVRRVHSDNKTLQMQVLALQRQDTETGILTYQEFQYRFESIWANLKRRSETGFLLKITLPPMKHVKDSVRQEVSRTALASVRSHYDIVGLAPNDDILVILQNTTEEGVRLVRGRFFDLLSTSLSAYVLERIVLEDLRIDLSQQDSRSWLERVVPQASHAEQERQGT